METLARQIVRLDGGIKTSRAENDAMESRIEARLAGMQAHMADWKADMADWKADMAKRETRMLLAVAGMIGLAVAILGILISLPASSLPPDPTMRRFTPRFSRGNRTADRASRAPGCRVWRGRRRGSRLWRRFRVPDGRIQPRHGDPRRRLDVQNPGDRSLTAGAAPIRSSASMRTRILS